ncbi:MAG: ROK family protein [Archangiaceae bacterium]|nr:ROK family protein [Archangiaceae bacterium]
MGQRSLLIAVDIGGTKTALMVADAHTHEPLALERFKTDTDASPEATAQVLKQHFDDLLEREGLSKRRIRAIGAAVPGQVDHFGNILVAGNLGWSDAPFRDLLAQVFKVPAFVEHDANSAAIGERWKGHATRIDDFVFLALGTGVGAGLYLGGHLHRGFHHAAGEVGNMLLRRRSASKPAGEDNLNDAVGSKAIKERAGAPPDVPAKDVLEDPDSARVAERVADEVAAAIINICTVVDPQLVVVGGGTATDALLTRVRYRVGEELQFKPEILRSALGEEAQLYGALFGALGVMHHQREAA